MISYTTLFEQQSYNDALDYYMDTLSKDNLPVWDYVVLTASNDAQALAYDVQIKHRQSKALLPKSTKFVVIPDRDGKRIGSGGATFSVIRYIREHESTFKGKRILCIHSGGDSKRVPQYSACGKLFSPVPRILPDGRRSTLFDEFMIGMSTVASRIQEGMLVCSGDVLLLFNALQIDFYRADVAALSIKENVEVGKNHGVYLKHTDGSVGSFLHKMDEKTLRSCGAVDAQGNVDIDTGAVIIGAEVLERLYSLVRDENDYIAFANDKAKVSFYADFLYPLAINSSLEQFYKEKPEGDYTDELYACRTRLWEALHEYKIKLIQLSPASFIHFGTTKELLRLVTSDMEKYRFLGWKSVINSNLSTDKYAISNSYVSRKSTVGEGSYIEDSRIHRGSVIGKNCVISGVTLDGDSVPDGVALHGLKLNDGRFVCRMYGVNDNPKENKLFGKALDEPLWTAKIYPICSSIEEAVRRTINNDIAGCELASLHSSFQDADVTAILPWQENLYEQVVAEDILDYITRGRSVEELKDKYSKIDIKTVNYLLDKASRLSLDDLAQFGILIRIYCYLARLTSGDLSEKMEQACLKTICEATLKGAYSNIRQQKMSFARDETVVKLPVRVNFGGGWSDTPPYCMENGGTVLNAAISINGTLPVEVTIRKIKEPCIILESTDIGSRTECTSIKEIQSCTDPADPSALHKAALIACGMIPKDGEAELDDILAQLGGGLYMNTRVINIPKGSGLGTSSILSGACMKAINEAFGLGWTNDELYERVLCMEQLMSTGGGWQDQVGGLTSGIKMVTTRSGLKQQIVCTPCVISDEALKELNDRYCIIYTGQRRLARNLLREVILKYISNDPVSVKAHYNIQRLAVLMRFELEKGNIDGFAKLMNEHWDESRKIDAGSTNTCINQIFLSIDDLIDGKMICGAGGGGFLQVVLKKGVSKADLKNRLYEVFKDSGVDTWDCEIINSF